MHILLWTSTAYFFWKYRKKPKQRRRVWHRDTHGWLCDQLFIFLLYLCQYRTNSIAWHDILQKITHRLCSDSIQDCTKFLCSNIHTINFGIAHGTPMMHWTRLKRSISVVTGECEQFEIWCLDKINLNDQSCRHSYNLLGKKPIIWWKTSLFLSLQWICHMTGRMNYCYAILNPWVLMPLRELNSYVQSCGKSFCSRISLWASDTSLKIRLRLQLDDWLQGHLIVGLNMPELH